MTIKHPAKSAYQHPDIIVNSKPFGGFEFGNINYLRFVFAKVLNNKNNWMGSYTEKGFKKKRKFRTG